MATKLIFRSRQDKNLPQSKSGIDKHILFVVLALLVFGVVMVANASVVDATRYFNDSFFYGKRQLFWSIIGLVSMFAASQIHYSVWQKIAVPLLAVTIILLIIVLIPGVGVAALGAKRWLSLGPIVLQPAELAKFSLCIYLAAFFSRRQAVLPFLAVLGVIVGLVMLEPDLGTTTIIGGLSLFIYFASGAPFWHFLVFLPSAVIVGLGTILSSSYRRDRLLTFLNPAEDPLGTSYHIRQVLIALGSGGLFGLGLGQSRQKYLFLPEPATDSIFAIIGEELGFVGGSIIILAFVYLVWRGLKVAIETKDSFGRLLAVGLISWTGLQAFVNLASMVAVAPLTGVPLPFLSYGGSALVANLTAMGILLNISKNK